MARSKVIQVIVEIPKGSRNKYEYDEKLGRFKLDRVLYSSVHYPADYGYVPDTLAEDGDPLDALVLLAEPTFAGCLVEGRVLGVLKMEDEKGIDHKILCAAVGDPQVAHKRNLSTVPQHLLSEIENFFEIYKVLEGKQSATLGWGDQAEALQIIEGSRKAYRLR